MGLYRSQESIDRDIKDLNRGIRESTGERIEGLALLLRRIQEITNDQIISLYTRLNKEKSKTENERELISRRARLEIDDEIQNVYRASLRNRQISIPLPDLVANGTKTAGLWIPHQKAVIERIVVCYETIPGSVLGTIVLDVYKRERARAALTIANASPDGDVIYTANEFGLGGEAIRVEHVSTAGGLAVSVAGNDITVDFGGTTPDSATVAAAVNAHGPAIALVSAAAGGDGTGLAGTAAFANLANGLVSTLIQSSAGYDLEALAAGSPGTVTDKSLSISTRRVRPSEYVYCEITSDNADALPGAGGVLTLTYSL
jgi:hypothetical protein